MNTCQVNVPNSGRAVTFHKCGRKLSGSEDYPELCGLHAAAERRALAKEQARADVKLVRAAEVKAANQLAERLSRQLGIRVTATMRYPMSGPETLITQPTGNATVKLADLERLVARLNEVHAELERWQRIDANQ